MKSHGWVVKSTSVTLWLYKQFGQKTRFCLEPANDGTKILHHLGCTKTPANNGRNYQPQQVLGRISEPSSLCHLSTLYKLIAPGAMFFRSLGAFFSTLAPPGFRINGWKFIPSKFNSEFTLEKWWERKTIRRPIGFRQLFKGKLAVKRGYRVYLHIEACWMFHPGFCLIWCVSLWVELEINSKKNPLDDLPSTQGERKSAFKSETTWLQISRVILYLFDAAFSSRGIWMKLGGVKGSSYEMMSSTEAWDMGVPTMVLPNNHWFSY